MFTEAFDTYYKDIIELNLTTEIDDFTVVRVDPNTGEVFTKAGRKEKADVANIVPNQRAGEIAHKAGCAEGDWCPVNFENFTAVKVPGIYVLGDAAIANEMPKSAFSANNQAKVRPTSWTNSPRRTASRRATAIPAGRWWRPTKASKSAPTTRRATRRQEAARAERQLRIAAEAADLRKATFQESLG